MELGQYEEAGKLLKRALEIREKAKGEDSAEVGESLNELAILAGRRALWQPSLALAVTIGLHPSTVVLSPALLYVAWVWGKGEGGKEGKAHKTFLYNLYRGTQWD